MAEAPFENVNTVCIPGKVSDPVQTWELYEKIYISFWRRVYKHGVEWIVSKQMMSDEQLFIRDRSLFMTGGWRKTTFYGKNFRGALSRQKI